jgi:putative addiction module component (TIGR02574 family)
MSTTLETLGIERIRVAERLKLIEEIWETIENSSDQIPFTDAQREELDRRLQAHESNPAAGSTWEQVRSRIWGEA